jgi:integrase
MSQLQLDQENATTLARSLALSGADLDWASKTLELFPVPSADFARYLFVALGRVSSGVPWLAEIHDYGPQRDALKLVLARLTEAKDSNPDLYPDIESDRLADGFSGDFALAGTINGAQRGRAKGLEALRAVLWVCQWRWFSSDDQRSSAIEILASAIRGVGRNADNQTLEPQMLWQLGQATTLGEFISAAASLPPSSIAEMWAKHIQPELLRVESSLGEQPFQLQGPGSPPPLPDDTVGPGPSFGPAPPSSQDHDGFDEDREIESLQAGVRYGYLPGLPGELEPLPGESVDEHRRAVHTAALPSVPKNKDGKDILKYQIQQSIWGRNYLLLPNHPDVLPLHTYGRVVQQLIAGIEKSEPASREQFGLLALLLQAITGHTPKALKAVSVLPNAASPHDPRRMEFLEKEGALRLSVFWQVPWQDQEQASFFKPEDHQVKHLEEVGSVFVLPVAPPILRVLRAAVSAIRALPQADVLDIEACLREAARHVSRTLGSKFTPGQLRASLSAHVFEQTRDTAITQLIAADSLSASKAPLSYYAPRVRDIGAAYWNIQRSLLGEEFPMPALADRDSRVGAKLLVRQSSATRMAGAASAALNFGVERLATSGRGREVHMAIVNHLGTMCLGALTHRPGEALLALTRDAIWIDGDMGGALFRDKIHDTAHDPRLVVLPPTVCKQIQMYLDHLQGLAERYPKFKKHVAKVLRGQAPLLFGWSEDDTPVTLTYTEWKSGLPECWSVLPLNWGRHWMRTRAIEEGIRPELVNMQLGHLEAVGYPFSGASPTEPEAFVSELAPAWERLVRLQGWKVVRGFTSTQGLATTENMPLIRWKQKILDHQTLARAARRKWQKAMDSKLRSYREAALAHVLKHPELIEKGVVARFETTDPDVKPHKVTKTDFERIRDELYESADDDMAAALARADALCRVAKKVNKRTGQTGSDPAPLVVLRRPVDNAFVPGMMKPVRQIHALREHLKAWSAKNHPGDWRNFPLACARVAMAMSLFGFCDDPKKIRGAIERRDKLQRPAKLVDVILVPYGDEPHQVLGLRGVAAAAFARLAWKNPKDPFPGWKAINRHVKQFLPDWAVGKGSFLKSDEAGLIGLLCENVAVTNRFELSPAARRALSNKNGTTDAHISEQVALIDGDPAGTIVRHWEEEGHAPSAPRSSLGTPGTGNSRSQYLALCSILPSPDRDTKLPLTGVVIASGQAAAEVHRAAVLKEIDAMLAEDAKPRRLQPIVRLLAGWTRDMLADGTARTLTPAFKTIETYLSRVGGGLVEIFGQSSLSDLDEAELEDAYIAVINAKRKTRSKAAAAILGLHQYGLVEFGLPEVDLAGVMALLNSEGRVLADARLIMPSERDAIMSKLEKQAYGTQASDSTVREEVRLSRHAYAALPVIAFRGARRSEALGLQYRDIVEEGEQIHVRVRANSSRRMKTARGRRRIDLPVSLFGHRDGSISSWARNERKRQTLQRSETAFVFAPLTDARSAIERNDIAEVCLQACREVTGRRHSRLHGFRHLVGMEQTLPGFLSSADHDVLSSSMRLATLVTHPGLTVLPRDLQAQILSLGHNLLDTTLQWYHHLAWLLRSRSDARLSDRYFGREIAATLLGVTREAMDWAAKRAPGTTKNKVWLDVQWQSRKVPLDLETELGPAIPAIPALPKAWTARELGGLLADANRLGSLPGALRARGADPTDADRIRQAVLPIELRLGRRLLDEVQISEVAGRPKRSLRQLDSAEPLEILWDWYDQDIDGLRSAIRKVAESVTTHLIPKDADKVRLSAVNAVELERLLGLASDNRLSVLREALGGGLESQRVPRPVVKWTQPTGEAGEAVESEDEEGAANAEEAGKPTVTGYLGLEIKRVLLVISLASSAI